MNDMALLGPWVRRFLLEHLVAERNLARNTQRSYRDALTLLIPFVAGKLKQSVDRLAVADVSPDLVRLFLTDLEQARECGINTRNQRLAAIHVLARFVGEHSPEHIAWCGQIRSIPFKKSSKVVIPYLDKPQMDALLGAPDRQTAQGRRDHALLLFLDNSGARAQEAAQLLVGELDLAGCSVKIRGKGGKERHCPLWPSTAGELSDLIAHRSPDACVFLNRCGHPVTRFGIHTLVEQQARFRFSSDHVYNWSDNISSKYIFQPFCSGLVSCSSRFASSKSESAWNRRGGNPSPPYGQGSARSVHSRAMLNVP